MKFFNFNKRFIMFFPIPISNSRIYINIISRCNNCGKIKIEFVATDANYLADGRGVRTGK